MEIPRDRLTIRFSSSGGPGGQNVNRVQTRVEVRFRLGEAEWLAPRVRSRLAELYPRRLTRSGDFVIVSSRYRTQARNLEDCIAKLQELVHLAARRRRRRIPTAPTAASEVKRRKEKKRRSRQKSARRWRPEEE
jgi:protein subunit release factor B